MSHLSSLRAERYAFAANDTEILAVSVDPAEGEKGQIAFAEHLGLDYPLVPDTGRNLSILYGAAQNPDQAASRMSVLIDKDGIVRLIDKQVRVRTHGADILAQMRGLGLAR